MMADVKIRNLDDRLHDAYRRMADSAGLSLEEQLRRVLSDYLSQERRTMLLEVERGLAEMEEKYGILPDSAPGIRADRDRRG
jgi:plasmid stability protein